MHSNFPELGNFLINVLFSEANNKNFNQFHVVLYNGWFLRNDVLWYFRKQGENSHSHPSSSFRKGQLSPKTPWKRLEQILNNK